MNPAALTAALRGDISNALIASTPGGIERQEAAGQRTLVASAMLPKEINGATREQLTAIGFKFGAAVADKIARAKTLDALDEAAGLIGAVANVEQQRELSEKFDARRVELQ